MQGHTVRDELIFNHTDMARRIALKMARRCPDWVMRDDLVAAGMLGLIEAAERYDVTRPEPFGAFAEQRIRGAVLDELRRGDIMPRRVRHTARKIVEAIRGLEAKGATATDPQIAEVLGVTAEHYRTNLAHLVHVGVDSLDESTSMIADLGMAPDELVGHRHLLGRVRAALKLLAERDVTILGMYYLEELTFQQIGDELAITPSRVCQLLRRAVERVRDQLGCVDMQHAA